MMPNEMEFRRGPLSAGGAARPRVITHREANMESRSFRYVLALMFIVLAVMTIGPHVEYRFYAATTPRPVDARGSLTDYENSTIALFERVSPSVVHVVGRDAANELSVSAADEGGIRTGTGFVWDQAGNVVTNDHVV